jgi:hypothetical protein
VTRLPQHLGANHFHPRRHPTVLQIWAVRLERIFVFWIPAVVFGIQFVVNVTWLLKAINSESCETASAPDLSGSGSGAATIRRS